MLMPGASLEGLQRRRLLALQLDLSQPPRASEASRLTAWLGVEPALFGTPSQWQPPQEALEQLLPPGQECQDQRKQQQHARDCLGASGLDNPAAIQRRIIRGRQALRTRGKEHARDRASHASQQAAALSADPVAGCSNEEAKDSSNGSETRACSGRGNHNRRTSQSSTSASSSRGKRTGARTASPAAAVAPVFIPRPGGPPAPEVWFLSDSGSDTDSDSGPQASRMRFRSCRSVADLCRPWRPASRGPAARAAAGGGGASGGGGGSSSDDGRGSRRGGGGGGGGAGVSGMPPLELLRADVEKMRDQRREWRRIARREDWVAEEAPPKEVQARGVQEEGAASVTTGAGATAAAGVAGLSAAGVVYGYCRPLDGRERLAHAAWRAARTDAVAAALPPLESQACIERIRENKEMVSIMQIMQMTPQARSSAEALMQAFQQKMIQSQTRLQAAHPLCQEVGRAALEFVHAFDTDVGRCRAAAAAAHATHMATGTRVLGLSDQEAGVANAASARLSGAASTCVAGTEGCSPSPQMEAEAGMALLWALAGMHPARLLGRRRECAVAALCRGLRQRLQRRGGGAGLLVHGSGGGGPGAGQLLTNVPPLVSEVHRELAVTELAARLRRLQYHALTASLVAGPGAAAAAAAASYPSHAAPTASTAAAAAAGQPSPQPETWLRLARMSLGAAYATASATAAVPAPHPSSASSCSTTSAAAANAGMSQPALFSPVGAAQAAWAQLMERAGGAVVSLWGPVLRSLVEEDRLRRGVLSPPNPNRVTQHPSLSLQGQQQQGQGQGQGRQDESLQATYHSRGVAGVAAVLARADPGALAAVAGLLPPATAVASGVSAAAGVTGGSARFGIAGCGGGGSGAAFGEMYWRLDWLGFFPVVTLGRDGRASAWREPARPGAATAAAGWLGAAAATAATHCSAAAGRQEAGRVECLAAASLQEAVLVGRDASDGGSDGRSGAQCLGELCAWLQAGRPVACAGGAAAWLVLTQLQQLQHESGAVTPTTAPAGGTIAGGLGVAWVPHRLVPPEEARHGGPARWLQPDGEIGCCCVVLQPLGPLLPPNKDSTWMPAADWAAATAWLSGAEALRVKNNSSSLSLIQPYLTASVAHTGRAALVCEGAEELEHAMVAMCQARAELLLGWPDRQLVCVARPVPLSGKIATAAGNDVAERDGGGENGAACTNSSFLGGSGSGVIRPCEVHGVAHGGGGGGVVVEGAVQGAARMVVALVEVARGGSDSGSSDTGGYTAGLMLQHPLAATGDP